MKQVCSVCVCPSDFDRYSLPVHVPDYYNADKALAQYWNRNPEDASCPRKLKSRHAEAAQFSEATLQFSFAGVWKAKDGSVRFFDELVNWDDYGLFHLSVPSWIVITTVGRIINLIGALQLPCVQAAWQEDKDKVFKL
jgi:hypothetical protein